MATAKVIHDCISVGVVCVSVDSGDFDIGGFELQDLISHQRQQWRDTYCDTMVDNGGKLVAKRLAERGSGLDKDIVTLENGNNDLSLARSALV